MDGVDHGIEFVGDVAILRDEAQPARPLDRGNHHLISRLVAEHDPRLRESFLNLDSDEVGNSTEGTSFMTSGELVISATTVAHRAEKWIRFSLARPCGR
jgi:hypothetical protein